MSATRDVGFFGDWEGPGQKMPTPFGSRCVDCGERIGTDDQGYIVDLGKEQWRAQHRRHRPVPEGS